MASFGQIDPIRQILEFFIVDCKLPRHNRMKDLNTIAHILSHYCNHRRLHAVEMQILGDWLNESQVNEDFFTDLSDNPCWLQDSPSDEIYNLIKSRLVLLGVR